MISILLPIALGVSSCIFIGRVSALEALSLVWLLVSAISNLSILSSLFSRKIARVGLCLLSSFFLLFSDIVNQTSFEVLIKGVGAYALFPVCIFFLTKVFSYEKLIIISFASSFSSFLLNRQDAEAIFSAENFKVGFAGAAITLSLFLFSYLPYRLKINKKTTNLLDIVNALLLVFLSAWGNLRLLSLLAFLSYATSYYYERLSTMLRLKRLTPFGVSVLFPVFILTFSIALSGAVSAVLDLFSLFPQGLISDVAIAKTRDQFTGSLGLLFGGRAEIFSSAIAWKEKWLLGWGSWALDPNDQFELAGLDLMRSLGYQLDFDNWANLISAGITYPFIPTHSAILSLLVWGGTLSVIPFYIFFSYFICNFLQCISSSNLSPPYFISFTFYGSLWNILFSPFGYSNRIVLEISCALVISYVMQQSCVPCKDSKLCLHQA